MVAWNMAILLGPLAEVYECLGSQVQGHSGRHGAFTIMHMCTCSDLTPKMTLCGT